MKISTFDLNLFVVLNAIYTEGSLTKAAEVVGITQPAVSNALARLREKFDDELFVRTGSGMVPTQKTENQDRQRRHRQGRRDRTAWGSGGSGPGPPGQGGLPTEAFRWLGENAATSPRGHDRQPHLRRAH